MNESEFVDLAEETIEAIQESIEESGADIDYDEINGVLTLEFENGSQIIFSKQTPAKQLWMAAKAGGFHFDYDEADQQWICDSGDKENLHTMLNRFSSEQSGESIQIFPE
ncbi:MAG: iron donor protein CyaY [Gammaproteobacteria bacterium]|nr:iron donor protein CyaY [Gammaproteobacteria bacterium]